MIRIKQLSSTDSSSTFEEGLRVIHETQGTNSAAQGHVYNYANEFSVYNEATSGQKIVADSSPIGFMRSMSVIPSFQGKGIGKALVSERMKWMSSNGIRRAWVMSWINGRRYNSGNVYRALNFELTKTLPDFFQTRECLVCGENCKCSIGIYVLDF